MRTHATGDYTRSGGRRNRGFKRGKLGDAAAGLTLSHSLRRIPGPFARISRSHAVALLLTFALLAAVLFALFWGGTLVAQGYFYQQPADRLPARAGGAAVLVAGFLTVWVWVDKNNPGKYDTFFEFAPYSTTTFGEFEAVRWLADPVAAGKGRPGFKKDDKGNPVEKVTTFRRPGGSKTAAFAEDGTGQAFKLNTADAMTAALVVKPDDGGTTARYKAELAKDGLTYAGERRFVEEGGSRYLHATQLGVLYVPSNRAVALALLLNFLLFAVWFAALWPVLQFNWPHALGLAAVLGLVTMLLVMPLVFKPNRAPPAAVGAAPAA